MPCDVDGCPQLQEETGATCCRYTTTLGRESRFRFCDDHEAHTLHQASLRREEAMDDNALSQPLTATGSPSRNEESVSNITSLSSSNVSFVHVISCVCISHTATFRLPRGIEAIK